MMIIKDKIKGVFIWEKLYLQYLFNYKYFCNERNSVK